MLAQFPASDNAPSAGFLHNRWSRREKDPLFVEPIWDLASNVATFVCMLRARSPGTEGPSLREKSVHPRPASFRAYEQTKSEFFIIHRNSGSWIRQRDVWCRTPRMFETRVGADFWSLWRVQEVAPEAATSAQPRPQLLSLRGSGAGWDEVGPSPNPHPGSTGGSHACSGILRSHLVFHTVQSHVVPREIPDAFFWHRSAFFMHCSPLPAEFVYSYSLSPRRCEHRTPSRRRRI